MFGCGERGLSDVVLQVTLLLTGRTGGAGPRYQYAEKDVDWLAGGSGLGLKTSEQVIAD